MSVGVMKDYKAVRSRHRLMVFKKKMNTALKNKKAGCGSFSLPIPFYWSPWTKCKEVASWLEASYDNLNLRCVLGCRSSSAKVSEDGRSRAA